MSGFVNSTKPNRALPVFLVLAASTTAALFACASSDEPVAVDTPTSEEKDSGGTVARLPDAETADASEDSDIDSGADTDAAKPIVDGGIDADAAPRTCSDDRFCYSTVPAGENLRGVWGDGQGVIWAVSTIGDVLRWDGTKWNIQASGLGSPTYLSGTSPTELWVVNAVGAVFHGTGASPATLSFASVALPVSADPQLMIKAVWGTSPTDVWALGGRQITGSPYHYDCIARVLHYTGGVDAGALDWAVDTSVPQNVMYSGAWAMPGGGIAFTGSSNASDASGWYTTATVVRRTPGASPTWVTERLPQDPTSTYHPAASAFVASAPNADGSMWLIGRTGSFNRFRWLGTSADDGATYTWTAYPQYSWDLNAFGVWGVSATDSWEVGEYGHMQHWNGTTWSQAAVMVTGLPQSKTFYAVWGTSNDDFWAVGDELAVHKTKANEP